MSDDARKTAERAIDLLVCAVGVALYLRDTVPTFVNLFVSRGRAELGQRRQRAQGQVQQAKASGSSRCSRRTQGPRAGGEGDRHGPQERGGRNRRCRRRGDLPGAAEDVPPPRTPSEPAAPSPARRAGRRESTAASTAPRAATLGIPDYDELSASQVVERLDGLPAGELDAVREYEEAHRARRTILYKIEQLSS